jgi:phenylpropionate dioxygenase-like ring-hydroxylating dioxygenase large terminal subunit
VASRFDATHADVTQMLQTRPRRHSLPGRFYNDPDIFALDIEAIFQRQWLFVGCTCEVEQPGQYLMVEIGASSIVVVRGTDGELRGFFNTCRHRGFRICDAEQGRAKSLVCPYHRWTYRLDGTLAYAAWMPADFDRAAYSLKPVHLRTLAGTIYICLADDPPDFAPSAEAMAPLLAPHQLDRARVAHKDNLVVDGNWKLMMENSRECFHCATEHRELMRTFLDIYDFSNPQEAATIRDFCARREAEGLPSHIAEGPEYRAARLPFTHGAVSITMDGKAAVARLLGAVPHNDIGSLRWVHYPTVFNHALGDYAVTVRMLPRDTDHTLVSTTWLVDRDAVEGRDYALDNLIKVWTATNVQDATLVKRNALGVRSVGYQPGPYSPAQEAGVIKFVEWYCEQMTRHLGGGRLRTVAA